MTEQPVQKSASETARYIRDTTRVEPHLSANVLFALLEYGGIERNSIDTHYIRRVAHHLGKF